MTYYKTKYYLICDPWDGVRVSVIRPKRCPHEQDQEVYTEDLK